MDVDVEHNGARRRCQGQGQGQGRGWGEQWKPWEAMFRNWGAGRGQTNPWSGCQQQQQREQQRKQDAPSETRSSADSEKQPKPEETHVPSTAAAATTDVADVQMGVSKH